MRINIAKQIMIGFIVAPLLIIATGGTSYFYLGQVNDAYAALVNERARAALDTHVIQYDAAQQMNFLNAYFATQESQYLQGFQYTNADLTAMVDKVSPLLPEEHREPLQEIQTKNKQLLEQSAKVESLLKSDPQQARIVISSEVFSTGTEIVNLAKVVVDQQELLMKVSSEESAGLVEHTRTMILAASLGAVVIALVIGMALAVKFTRSLRLVNRQLEEIAQGDGDLTKEIRIESKDEFGQLASSFNRMLGNLRKLVHQVSENADNIARYTSHMKDNTSRTGQAAEQIASTVTEVAAGAEKQHSSVMESSRIIDDISEHAKRISIKSEGVSVKTSHTRSTASDGNASIQAAMQQMSSVHDKMSLMKDIVSGLQQRSQDIGSMIQLIHDIARQTNLLALNAGIESARAGEHGKGFEVVAKEVRKLAVRSSESADHIIEAIALIRDETQKAALWMQASMDEVTEGLQLVNDAGSSFDHIVRTIHELDDEFQEVVRSSAEMAAETAHVAETIHTVAEIAATHSEVSSHILHASTAQQSTMGEMTASTQELAMMARELEESVRRFKVK
ncbi:methyl-accepting chemotaxis protein [Paenibacillus sp. YYML68]|uniref:methyl-accepting chemotaxis protein n=1 Tax=Paenibacillus sp. YYML68 TaxID=2909250 RepID=UPI0024922F82|nr:methyl-accepting chemotaxis protein [Paenibacillus sp. YYML68]